jgi:hypothetical protein
MSENSAEKENTKGEEKSSGKDNSAITIVYVGNDESYWSTLVGRYRKQYKDIKFIFKVFHSTEVEAYEVLFKNILDLNKRDIIYIDFSYNLDAYKKLSLMIGREGKTSKIPQIGLVEDDKQLKLCRNFGTLFYHIKCGELHDVVYDPMRLKFPDRVKPHEFARAEFEHEAELIDDFRVGYITPTSLHAEGNLKLEKGQRVTLEIGIDRRIVPSSEFILTKIESKNLYYDYNYSYQFNFLYANEPTKGASDTEVPNDENGEEPVEDVKISKLDDEAIYQEKVLIYQDQFKMSKRALRDWVEDNQERSEPKKTKLLIIDKEMHIMEKKSQPYDSYLFTIRIQTEIASQLDLLDRLRPNLIVLSFYLDPPEEIEEKSDSNVVKKEDKSVEAGTEAVEEVLTQKESLAELKAILTEVKKLDKYEPFILVFNIKRHSSESLRKEFSYPLIIANELPIEFKSLIDMAKMFEKKILSLEDKKITEKWEALKKKDPKKFGRVKKNDVIESRYYIKNSSPLSHAYTSYPIVITAMDESSINFTCEMNLDLKKFRLKFPTNMMITLIPNDEGQESVQSKDGKFEYTALIHAIDETRKKQIRQFVNEIFFSDINAQREKEDIEFAELNQTKQIEKDDEASKKDDEASKKDDEASKKDDEASNKDDDTKAD